jgi:hypothetical protein
VLQASLDRFSVRTEVAIHESRGHTIDKKKILNPCSLRAEQGDITE